MTDTVTAKGLTGRALGEAVIDQVLTFPEQHNQTCVADICGTAACIAGWVLVLNYASQGHSLREGIDRAHSIDVSCEPNMPDTHPSVLAANLLGVPHDEFEHSVFLTFDRDKAVSNLKHLLDETYSERAL